MMRFAAYAGILTNLCLLIVGFLLFGLQRLLYGRLRPIETEQLYEKAWFAVTETCLAMTIFRGELGGWFVVMFVCLLVGKVWGWIGEGRVEILEQQPPSNPRLFHTRLAISLLLAVFFNTFMLEYAVKTVLRQARPDMMVTFGFEFAVLTILSTSTTARYALSLAEIYIVRQQKRARRIERRAEIRASREEILRTCQATGAEPPVDLPNEDDLEEMELDVPGWEEKGRCIFYLDLVTDFFKLIVYLSFFAILFTFYGLPIHILRDVVLTMRSFTKRILDFIRYRNATRDMNQRYPDATADEIAREDVCIICREEMQPWQPPGAANDHPPPSRTAGRVSERLRPKKLPCGHLLHFACLRSWLERQQNCPTCRRPVTIAGRGHGHESENAAARANQRHGENGLDPGGRPRAWVVNLGPLRVGFGAGRGDQFQDMAQQLNAAQTPANRGTRPNLPETNRQPAAPNPGFAHPTPLSSGFTSATIQNQIFHLEQQINQEINSLFAASDQLQVVRLLQAELARLRSISSNRSTGLSVPHNPILSGPSNPNPLDFQQHLAPNTHPVNPSSVENPLPEGVRLPPGWTLLPLQTAHSQTQGLNSPFNNLSSPHQPTTSIPASSSSQLSSGLPQVIFDGGPLHPTGSSLTSHFGREGQTSFNNGIAKNTIRPPDQDLRSQSASPPLDWTEIKQDRNIDNTTMLESQNTFPKSSPQRSPSDADDSLSSAPDPEAIKGKSRAATVEDLEE
ncbi:conserved hypothetical protein [Uncinocarpus reesii 1704]|uniref:RING-type E3 ubiquitin transferase n=1 Tax=Uncinocarpus reesii (strain UAMH 1704) TaxID=336963 RepID=C4JIK3_UNCRE|nr:uncharacterized protein UREG_01540 [Uncinocarpus reesii 1704]EEP76691.1 conserved hypothetical protein [Uncinocarpus reesii 1704]